MHRKKNVYEYGKCLEIEIGEHLYVTPPMPLKKEFLFYDLPQKDQYWRRQTDFPQIFYDWHREGAGVETEAEYTQYDQDTGKLLSLSRKDTLLLLGNPEDGEPEGLQFREKRRRKEGVWFFNDGEPVYLTGDHYASLQWFPMLGGTNDVEPGSKYGMYYDFQAEVFYYFDICENTKHAVGGVLVKSKKTGVTQIVSHICLNRATMLREINIRMMSIKEDVAKDTIFQFILHSVKGIPPILLPSIAKDNLGEIRFGAPQASRNPASSRKRIDNTPYLDSWLAVVPTVRAAFDSLTNYIAWIDEFPKIKDSTYPQELFTATIAAVKEGARRKGTLFATSYVPEKSDRSFEEARVIYKDSKLNTVQRHPETGNMIGKTKSELLCHTLTVDKGIFGCCDKYGRPIWDDIYTFLDTEAKKAEGDPLALQAFRRQYPNNESEPWQVAATGDSIFDTARLGAKMIDLENQYAIGQRPFIEFNLEYTIEPTKDKYGNHYKFPEVIKMDIPSSDELRKGGKVYKFKWYRPEWTPDRFMSEHTNKAAYHPKTGLRIPNPNAPFFISMDPTNYRQSKMTQQGSKNSICAFVLPNAELDGYVGQRVSDIRLMFEYYYRADNPQETLADMVKLVLYLNCYMLIESNMVSWIELMVEMGLEHFMLVVNTETGMLEPYDRKRLHQQKYLEDKGDLKERYINAGKEHLALPILPGDVDKIQTLDSLIVIDQLMKFSVENATHLDAAVGYLIGIYGAKSWLGYLKHIDDKRNKRHSGALSTAVNQVVKVYHGSPKRI